MQQAHAEPTRILFPVIVFVLCMANFGLKISPLQHVLNIMCVSAEDFFLLVKFELGILR